LNYTEKDILTIIQDAQTVPLGSFMWKSGAEYDKLVKIIHSAIDYTTPRELSDEEIDRVVDETYGVPRNKGIYASHRRLARAILKKASEK